MKQLYPTDISDEQWHLIKDFFPGANDFGRPRQIPARVIYNAIVYVLASGIQWRMMPNDLPKWKTVHHYFRQWRLNGVWAATYERLRVAERKRCGRDEEATAGSLDSQSVKTGRYCEEAKSYDAGKKVVGRKRHLLVDTQGLPIAIVVTRAGASDHEGAELVLKKRGQAGARLKKVWVDGTYRGKQWQEGIKAEHGIELEEVQREEGVKGWQLLAKRWVVERTFGWYTGARRLVKDYELKVESSEAMMQIRMISILVKRLAPAS